MKQGDYWTALLIDAPQPGTIGTSWTICLTPSAKRCRPTLSRSWVHP
jgi:hypothetical protein